MDRRILTLHLNDTRLTPQLVEVLRAVSEQYSKPKLHFRNDGLAVYLSDWRGLY